MWTITCSKLTVNLLEQGARTFLYEIFTLSQKEKHKTDNLLSLLTFALTHFSFKIVGREFLTLLFCKDSPYIGYHLFQILSYPL